MAYSKKAQARYDNTNTTGLYLKLNNKTDSDIIAYMKTVDNKQGLVKQLIREYMAKSVPVSAPDCTIVPVSVPDKYMDDLRKEAKENLMTVPELLWSAAKGDMPWLVNKYRT